MSSKYTYSIQTDFPSSAADSSRLRSEIVTSAIVTAFDYINVSGDDCDVWFKAALSEGDKTILDGLVAAHEGEPLPAEAMPVSLSGVSVTTDGRINIRNTTANYTQNYSLRVFSWQTSNPSSVHNCDALGEAYGDVTITMYDVNNAVTTTPAECVKEVIDFEPTYNYDVLGGWLDIPDAVKSANPGLWYVRACGVPDVAKEAGGCVEFIGEVDLVLVKETRVAADGRGTQYMQYNATYHTSKIRYVILHPAGAQHWFQLFIETFV